MGAKNNTNVPVARISEIYNTVRHPMGNRVLEASRKAGQLSELVAPGFEEVMEGETGVPLEKLVELLKVLCKDWEWVWKESAEDDRKRALELLRLSEVATKP
jgi:salicylate hydroxylase